MARARSRSRSYSPRPRGKSPPRERKSYDDYRHRERPSSRDHESSDPSGLLIRNLPLDARPNDLRDSFERFGPLRDIYLPRNYYTGEPRGFGFVKYRYAEDAAKAMKRMNHKVIGGREIAIVFAEENRKTPREMRTSGRYEEYKRTSRRSPRHRYRSHSRSLSPARREPRHSKAREDDSYSPRRSRSISRSPLLRNERQRKSHNVSQSPRRNCRSPREERVLTRSRSLSRSRSRSMSR
ncbi:serine/arginine-rich SC35-like splicing factor SCL28 [Eutrema salsugineum]|uniref:serine/arginine-rich SC35-like splicing factor SCL28 n=1 Tax=Eutrema salsugineum TaxID=72664 RepID=UPI000CED21A4|nr:serine/arginine-rich SC35-like splicing factor SCL28 [Eutrema salsugineum]